MEKEKTLQEQTENLTKAITDAFTETEKELKEQNEDKDEDKKQEIEETKEEKEVKEEVKEEKKEEKEEDGKEKYLYVDVSEYDFIPNKFKVVENGKLNLRKTIEKISKSYVHLESYASRKNNENEKLKRILNEIKEKQTRDEEDLTEKEIEEMMENPRDFLKKYKEKIMKQKEIEKENPDNEIIDRVNMWIIQNDIDDKTKEEMGNLFNSMSEQEKTKWALLPVEDLLDYLKLKVENKKLKTGERYIPKPPAVENTQTIKKETKSKPNIDSMAYFIGKEFGLSEDEIKKNL